MIANNSGRGPAGGSRQVVTRVAAPPRPAAPAPAPAASHYQYRGVAYKAAGSPKPAPSSFVHGASAPTRALAQKIAKAPAAPNRLSAAIAGRSQIAAQFPFAPIAGSDLVETRALRQMMFQGQFNQDFQALKDQGLIPGSAKEPSLSFPLRAMGSLGELSFETGSGNNAQVHISPSVLFQATQTGGFTPGRAWALETPIHELAHALQPAALKQSVPLREGGAQAFADAAAIKVLGPISENDTNYTNYVNMVRRLGPQFYMRNQFRQQPTQQAFASQKRRTSG